jgi:hypothetical protein
VALGPSGCDGQCIDMYFADTCSTVADTHTIHGLDAASHVRRNSTYMSEGVTKGCVVIKELSNLLIENGFQKLDLLSIDVEGFEFEVLDGLKLDERAPAHIIIETDACERIKGVLGNRYRLATALSHYDYLFVKC